MNYMVKTIKNLSYYKQISKLVVDLILSDSGESSV